MSHDVQILKGFSNIANAENIKPGMNIEELEDELVNDGLVMRSKETADKFNDEIKNLAKQFGVNFNEVNEKPMQHNVSHAPLHAPLHSVQSHSYDTDQDDDVTIDSPHISSPFSRVSNIDGGSRPQPSYTTSHTTPLYEKTQEQERRSHINSVMNEFNDGSGSGFSFEKEKREDVKCVMLEEIDSLLYSLQDEEVDLSRVPKVDSNNTYEEVEAVLKMLRHKNDRIRYCSLAEEFILWGAYGMEELFDGKRMWFNKYQPCLTGWHTNVQCKLRRMRHDTSQIVNDVMRDYNIGPGARILLELVPNMFIYSNIKRRQHGQDTMYLDEDIAASTERVRNL